jgi:hypothetical protein
MWGSASQELAGPMMVCMEMRHRDSRSKEPLYFRRFAAHGCTRTVLSGKNSKNAYFY